MNRDERWALACAIPMLLACVGCAETLPVPPSRLSVADSPGTVGAGNTELAAGGGIAGSVFNGSAGYGTVSLTHGVRDDLDVRADVTAGGIVVDPGYRDLRVTAFGAARLGVEKSVVPGILSLIAGVGGGASRAGGFVSADLGVLVGFENRYVTPFAGGVFHVGSPISPPTLRMDYFDDGGSMRTVYREAYAAFGWVASAGVRIPFGGHRTNVPHRYALQLSGDFGASYGNDVRSAEPGLESITYGGAHLTFRTVFGNPRDPR